MEDRIRALSQATGVPVPFECHYACEVADAEAVEKSLLDGLKDKRINPKREFLEIAPERVVALLKPHTKKDVTPSDEDTVADDDDREVLQKEAKREEKTRFV